MIDIENLHFAYKHKFALHIARFTAIEGTRVLIKGPSGCGKTTFLMLLRGILQPKAGRICVLGHNLNLLNDRERRLLRLKEIGSIFQQPTLLPYLTVKENLSLTSLLGHRFTQEPTEHPLVDRLGVRPILDRYPKQLSGGEVQRVSLIRPFLHNPRLLIADEPTNHLDSDHKKCLIALLKEYRTSKNLTLIVSHDENLDSFCDEVIDFSGFMS